MKHGPHERDRPAAGDCGGRQAIAIGTNLPKLIAEAT